MNVSSSDTAAQVPLLPGEAIEIVFDSRGGLAPGPTPGGDAIILTNERVMRDGAANKTRVVSMFPLRELSAVEVANAERSFDQLVVGFVLIGAGLVLGGLSWFILSVEVLSVVLGGLPILAGIYMLTGWIFPDTEGALHLYAQGHALAIPLRSAAARQSVYEAMQLIYELRWRSAPVVAEADSSPVEPEAEDEAETMESTLTRLVEEPEEAEPDLSAPEQPHSSIWDIFRRKS